MGSLILLALFSYLVGAIPTGVIIGKIKYGINLQKAGSGNTGASNALRVLGPIPALLVFAGDVGKALVVLTVTRALGYSPDIEWWMGVLAVFGHIYPVYLGFKGGKGLATGAGLVVFKAPFTLIIFIFFWCFVYIFAKHVPISSVTGMLGVLAYLFSIGVYPGVVGCVLVIYRHAPEAWSFWALRKG